MPRLHRPVFEASRRESTFAEVVHGLDAESALYEARRRMSCGTCFSCDNCLGVCPDDAVIKLSEPGIPYLIDLDYCKGCGLCASECPAGAIQTAPEEIQPAASPPTEEVPDGAAGRSTSTLLLRVGMSNPVRTCRFREVRSLVADRSELADLSDRLVAEFDDLLPGQVMRTVYRSYHLVVQHLDVPDTSATALCEDVARQLLRVRTAPSRQRQAHLGALLGQAGSGRVSTPT